MPAYLLPKQGHAEANDGSQPNGNQPKKTPSYLQPAKVSKPPYDEPSSSYAESADPVYSTPYCGQASLAKAVVIEPRIKKSQDSEIYSVKFLLWAALGEVAGPFTLFLDQSGLLESASAEYP